MRLFKSAWFARFAAKEGIGDEALKAAVDEMERGLCGDPLGGGVYKKRLARAGAGKSGGYRVIMYYRSGERTFFVYGFAKSDMDNIGDDVLRDFKEGAKDILKLPDTQIETALKTGKLVEVI